MLHSNLTQSTSEALLAATTGRVVIYDEEVGKTLRLTLKEQERRINALADAFDRDKRLKGDFLLGLEPFLRCFNGGLGEVVREKCLSIVISALNIDDNLKIEEEEDVGEKEGDDVLKEEQIALSSLLALNVIEAVNQSKSKIDWGNHLKQLLAQGLWRLMSRPSLNSLIVGVLVKAAHGLLESSPASNSAIVTTITETLVLAVNRHAHALHALLLQDLTYSPALTEAVAQVCARLVSSQQTIINPDNRADGEQEEDAVSVALGRECVTNVLQALNVDEEAAGRTSGAFLLRLAQKMPAEEFLRVTAGLLEAWLDARAYGMRMAMIDVLLHVIVALKKTSAPEHEQQQAAISSLLEAVRVRFSDTSSFVRAKAVAAIGELLVGLPVTARPPLILECVGRLQDKAGNVRRRAVQALVTAIRAHPFCVDGGMLQRALFETRLAQITDSKHGLNVPEDGDEATLLMRLQQIRYYQDALDFVRMLEGTVPSVCKLLALFMGTGTGSTAPCVSRSEVCDLADYVAELRVYGVEAAEAAVLALLPIPLIHSRTPNNAAVAGTSST